MSCWLLAGWLDRRESWTDQSHRTRIDLGSLWSGAAMLGSEPDLDDLW